MMDSESIVSMEGVRIVKHVNQTGVTPTKSGSEGEFKRSCYANIIQRDFPSCGDYFAR
jgi:hypothetical protein